MYILSVIIVFCLATVAKCFCMYENADPVDVYICNLGGYITSYIYVFREFTLVAIVCCTHANQQLVATHANQVVSIVLRQVQILITE